MLTDLIIALLLGIVEGATEFIPVSSTGHLIVASDWLGFVGSRANTFNVFIQLGAILAIVWLYRERLLNVLRPLPVAPATWTQFWRGNEGADPAQARAMHFATAIAIAFVPAAILGFLFDDYIDAYLFNPVTVAAALVVGGIAMLVIERQHPVPHTEEAERVTFGDALRVGLAQCLALFPGVSRSGATIMGGYAFGLSRKAATEFSFFLAIPVMFAATLYKLAKATLLADAGAGLTAADIPLFAVGFVVSFLAAVFFVRFLVSYVSRHTFDVFAWYRIVFGLVLLALYFFFGTGAGIEL